MNKVQRFFLNLKNKSFKGEQAPERKNVNYEDAKSVAVLFNSDQLESTEGLSDFIKHLIQDGKQVKVLTFQHSKTKGQPKSYNFNHHTITEKDISIFGEINSFLVDDFLKTEFDYLFCIADQPFDVFDSILMRSKAKCRIGKYMEGNNNFELMIKLNDNEGTNALIKQMYFYVKTIKND